MFSGTYWFNRSRLNSTQFDFLSVNIFTGREKTALVGSIQGRRRNFKNIRPSNFIQNVDFVNVLRHTYLTKRNNGNDDY